MKISKKTDYALRTLFTLVEYYGHGPVPIRELATRNQVPKRFLEHIMLELKSQGWVDSMPGKNGGYILAKAPEEITLGQITRYFDGILAPIGCVSMSRYQKCSQEEGCMFRAIMANIRDCAAEIMDRSTLQGVYLGLYRYSKIYSPTFMNGDGI
ncbi:MAG TPA: Rrf2 family transcriptional regulator [Clostridia bacterium]|nr:Rrf2 family transcriptional regulator [Clostridia bacterium]